MKYINKYTNKKIDCKKIADEIGKSEDMVRKYVRLDAFPSRETAKKLEEMTGMDRIRFLYPKEHGNPWEQMEL